MSYPHTKNHFRVEWGGTNVGFMEVSGLSIELDVVDYREGSSPENSVRKMPGMKKFSDVVLKRGLLKMMMIFIDGSAQQRLTRLRDAML